jgi:hypothetical protein
MASLVLSLLQKFCTHVYASIRLVVLSRLPSCLSSHLLPPLHTIALAVLSVGLPYYSNMPKVGRLWRKSRPISDARSRATLLEVGRLFSSRLTFQKSPDFSTKSADYSTVQKSADFHVPNPWPVREKGRPALSCPPLAPPQRLSEHQIFVPKKKISFDSQGVLCLPPS